MIAQSNHECPTLGKYLSQVPISALLCSLVVSNLKSVNCSIFHVDNFRHSFISFAFQHEKHWWIQTSLEKLIQTPRKLISIFCDWQGNMLPLCKPITITDLCSRKTNGKYLLISFTCRNYIYNFNHMNLIRWESYFLSITKVSL